MKEKKLFLTYVLLAITIVAYITASLALCYTTKPKVTTGEFPFSITYEYKGEINTFEGIFACEYSGSRTVLGEHKRHWEEETIIENPLVPENNSIIDQREGMVLAIHENMSAGYFMGDPLYSDYYQNYNLDGVQPYIEYHNYDTSITLGSEEAQEVLDSIGFKVLDYSYPEPIENDFYLSGVQYSGDNVIFFVLISLVFLILCLIFVRKDKEYKYSVSDKVGICLNFIIGIVAVPFITFFCSFYELVGSDGMGQFVFNIPSASILCLALSISFRRKGMRKSGFYIQFVGIVLFALMFVLDAV